MRRLAGLCMVGVLLLTGCGETKTTEVPELINAVGVDMDTEEVVRMDLSGVTSFSAQIVPTIEGMSFLSSGSIESLKVSVGDKVKKGQLLATLSGASGKVKTLKSEIKSFKEQNANANKQSQVDIEMLEQTVKELQKKVRAEKSASVKKKLKEQLEGALMDVKIAEEKLEQQKELQKLELKQKMRDLKEAQENTKHNKLYSTIDGEVIGTTGGTGYMVQGGNVAIQVANMEKPRLKTTYVSSAKIAKAGSCIAVIDGKQYEVVAEEQELSRIDIEQGNHPDYTWFDFVDEKVDAAVGKSASIELHTDSVDDALVVPVNAVFGTGTEKYVYVVTGDARTKTAVTTGTQTDAYVQIVTGVEEGDVVYVED